jgi:hypothetical protein
MPILVSEYYELQTTRITTRIITDMHYRSENFRSAWDAYTMIADKPLYADTWNYLRKGM